MQNAKDTFYITLRNRLAVLNPERTVVVRGAVRPAVVVLENELEGSGSEVHGAFLLGWTGHATDSTEPMPLDSAQCEIRYSTEGTPEMAGMDRGRVLEAMDAELSSILLPGATAKQEFADDPAVILATNIFWSAPTFGAAEMKNGALTRAVTVVVFSLREVAE